MRHYIIDDTGSHYGVSVNCFDTLILVQLQNEFGEQTRVKLTKEQAEHLVKLIQESIAELKE